MSGVLTDPAALPPGMGAVPRRAFVEQIMGLPISVHVRGPHAREPVVAQATGRFFDTLHADDARFSTYLPASEVSQIRRGLLRIADASPRLREVAALCEQASARTGGSFDAWLPGPDGERRFDPSGLVKGWAVEQAFASLWDGLARRGQYDVLVSAGGDVLVRCARTDTPDWAVGIEDPRDRSRTLLTVPLRTGAVATSGTAARGAHILDPVTGSAATGLLSATVIGPELTWADVFATAAFVRGAGASAWLPVLPGHAGVLVTATGRVEVTAPAGVPPLPRA